MEKLTFRFIKLSAVAALVAVAAPAFAGQGFRFNSKAPIAQPTAYKGYVFGYGGWDSGADWSTLGGFDGVGGEHYDHYEDYAAPLFDPTAIPINFDLDSGWTLGGGVGVYSHLFNGSRFELEGGYINNSVGDLTYAGFELPANFDIKTTTLMFNMLKEVPLGQTRAKGYFGGGVGYAWTTMEGDIDTILYDDSDGGFAWQLIAGVDLPITERLALFLQYRYLVLSSELTHETNFGDFRQTTLDSPSSHGVQVGVRVSF